MAAPPRYPAAAHFPTSAKATWKEAGDRHSTVRLSCPMTVGDPTTATLGALTGVSPVLAGAYLTYLVERMLIPGVLIFCTMGVGRVPGNTSCAQSDTSRTRPLDGLNRPGFGGGSLVESQATRLIRSPSSYRASNSVGGLPPQAP